MDRLHLGKEVPATGRYTAAGPTGSLFSDDTTRTGGDRAKRSFKVQARRYLGPRPALAEKPSTPLSNFLFIRSDHNPGSTPQCILQITLVDPVNEHQQIIGAVQELPPIDLGANQPFLTITG